MAAANNKPLLTAEPVWQQLQKYYNENGAKINIKELFEQDDKRFDKFRWVHAMVCAICVQLSTVFAVAE